MTEQLDFITRPQDVHRNSKEALKEERKSGRLAARQRDILQYLECYAFSDVTAKTDRDIMSGLNLTEPNQVRPRITELIARGYAKEAGSVIDCLTGRWVRLVHITNLGRAKLMEEQ